MKFLFLISTIVVSLIGCKGPSQPSEQERPATSERRNEAGNERTRAIHNLREANCSVTESPLKIECPQPNKNGSTEAEYENYAKIGAATSVLRDILAKQSGEWLPMDVLTLCQKAFIPLDISAQHEITNALSFRARFTDRFHILDYDHICRTGSTEGIKPALEKARVFKDTLASLSPLLVTKAYDWIIIGNEPNSKYGTDGYEYSSFSQKGLIVHLAYSASKSEITELFESLDPKSSPGEKQRLNLELKLVEFGSAGQMKAKGIEVKISFNRDLVNTSKLIDLYKSLLEVKNEVELGLRALPTLPENSHGASLEVRIGNENVRNCEKTNYSQSYLLTQSPNSPHLEQIGECLRKIFQAQSAK